MKLKTTMADIDKAVEFAASLGLGSGNVKDEIHDAAGLRALMQAIEDRMFRAIDIQNHDEEITLRMIIRYADELMREWGFVE